MENSRANREAEPLAYLNGRFLPAHEAAISLYDAGFVLGATVSERLRTFGGKLFLLEEHLRRMKRSLEIIGLGEVPSFDAIRDAAPRIVAHNHSLLGEGDDLALAILVTPGPIASLAPEDVRLEPTVCLHTHRLPFHRWADKYSAGERICVANQRQVPPECWPVELKCRSRMHYFLADTAAHRRNPPAQAVLLDLAGNVTETSSANVLVVEERGGLVSPPLESILPGISLEFVRGLADQLQIPWTFRPLVPPDIATASEVLLTSTSYCVLPVTTFHDQPIGDGRPGPVFRKLIEAWGRHVGTDIIGQAQSRL